MLFKGFPSSGIVRCFEISVDSLFLRAKYLSTGARRADLSQFILWLSASARQRYIGRFRGGSRLFPQ